MSQKQTPNYTFALTVVIIVCFLIGFITTMNNSMIEFCKKTFELSEQQGQYVNSAFYGAYALSIPLAMLMNKIGYKMTLVGGLAVVGLGFLLNYVGISAFADDKDLIFPEFLACMSCVAIGVVLLQLVANPYVMVLGSPEKGAFRMTLSQALNSVATTIAPLFVSILIMGNANESAGAGAITGPFLGLCIATVILCVILSFLKLPNIQEGEQETEASGEAKIYKSSVFKYPHVYFGALAIFAYMGLEIGVPSMLPAYFKADPTLTGSATTYLPFYWGGMMVGRFAGAAILSKFKPRTLLLACLVGGAVCVSLSFVLSGFASVYAMLAAGLFHSVMWPLIFNLGLQELGPHTKSASGIINMGVIGAATLMPLMGAVVDNPTLGVGCAIGMMFVYYAYVVWFTLFGSRWGLNKVA